MDVATDLNTKLETALNVEFVVADNLREQIYAALTDLNSITRRPTQPNQSQDNIFGSENEEEGLTEVDSHDLLDNSTEDEMDEGPPNSDATDAGVKFNCFPSTNTDHGKIVKVIPLVPSTKLSYLNHAELLRKYSGV